MTSNSVLRWPDGRGWVVLSGGPSDAVRAHALSVAAADGGVAYVALRDATAAEMLMLDMDDLGAPAGYLVNMQTDTETALFDRLAEASVIVIGNLTDAETWCAVLTGAAAAGIYAAYEHGAVILAEGTGAAALGGWIMTDEGDITPGLGWLENALIFPGLTSAGQSERARYALTAQPAALAVGVGSDSALALGPDGQVETWGQQHVTIALGSHFGTQVPRTGE